MREMGRGGKSNGRFGRLGLGGTRVRFRFELN